MLVGTYNAQYIGKSMCGFKNSHEYCVEISKDEYGYAVEGVSDLTEDKGATSAYIPYASETSLKRNWIIIEDITKLGGV